LWKEEEEKGGEGEKLPQSFHLSRSLCLTTARHEKGTKRGGEKEEKKKKKKRKKEVADLT